MKKGRALAQIVVVTPDTLEKKMTFVNADDMKQALHDSGKVALYGLYFDTDKDAVKAESQPTLAEIAKLMKSDASLRLHVVGHTDNQGKARLQPGFESQARRECGGTVDRQVWDRCKSSGCIRLRCLCPGRIQ